MIQAKIFTGYNSGVIEKQINTWLADHSCGFERIVIINITQSSTSVEKTPTTVHIENIKIIITIFYEVVKK